MRDRLRARGYSKKCLARPYNRTKDQSRDSLLFHKKTAKPASTVRFITRFNCQHDQLKAILQKHWYLLTQDPAISKFVPPQPTIVYRRASSLKDKLVHSHLSGSNFKTNPLKGTFKFGRCSYCKYINTNKNIILLNGETQGVVYLMTCECSAFYVGKTFRGLLET